MHPCLTRPRIQRLIQGLIQAEIQGGVSYSWMRIVVPVVVSLVLASSGVAHAQEDDAAPPVDDAAIGRSARLAVGGEVGFLGYGAFFEATTPTSRRWSLGGRLAFGSTDIGESGEGNECSTFTRGGLYSSAEMVARLRIPTGSYSAFWAMGGAGLGIATGTKVYSCALIVPQDFVSTTRYVDPAALASVSAGMDFYSSQRFAISAGLRLQISTLGTSFSDGTTRWFSIPFPAGLLTLGMAFYEPR